MSTSISTVAFIVPYGQLDSIPTLLGLMQALAEKGVNVDVYYPPYDSAPSHDVPFPNVTLVPMERFTRGGLTPRMLEICAWVKHVRTGCRQRQYDLLIGIDANGLLVAASVARSLKIPYVYFSLEVLFWTELRRLSTMLQKVCECVVFRRARGVIIQDTTRADLLLKSCFAKRKPVVELPNCWRGLVHKCQSNMIREKLGIDSNKTIVLNVGSCKPWAMVAELAEAANSWPSGIALVIQVRERLGQSPYEARLHNAVNGRTVYLLAEPCPSESFVHLVASADVGLAFYSDLKNGRVDRNIRFAGKSSGKFSTYLQAGLPVITNRVGGISPYVIHYGCGNVVESPQDIYHSVLDICANVKEYRSASQACFEAEFASERYEPFCLAQLQSWMHSR